jgi:integrase
MRVRRHVAAPIADEDRRVPLPRRLEAEVIVDAAVREDDFCGEGGRPISRELRRRGWEEMPRPLFCTQIGTYPDPSNIRRAFEDVLRAAKLPHFTPHGLRHTFASLLLQAGVDVYYVSRMLGHADISLTVNTYGSWLHPSRPGALDVLDRAAPPASEVAR